MPAQYRALNAAEAAHMERYRLLDRYRQRSVDALMDALIENEMLAFREQCVSAFTRIGRDELPASPVPARHWMIPMSASMCFAKLAQRVPG